MSKVSMYSCYIITQPFVKIWHFVVMNEQKQASRPFIKALRYLHSETVSNFVSAPMFYHSSQLFADRNSVACF